MTGPVSVRFGHSLDLELLFRRQHCIGVEAGFSIRLPTSTQLVGAILILDS